MANMTAVPGEDKGTIVVYGLSTCGWCARTKKYLSEKGIGYSFVDVDTLSGIDSQAAKEELKRWNPRMSFPTTVVRDEKAIVGFDQDKLAEAIG